MSNVKKLNFKLDYLPLEEMGKKFLPSCTSTYDAQPLCKVLSKSVKRFRRSCAYEEMWTDGRTDGRTDRQGDSYILVSDPFFARTNNSPTPENPMKTTI